MRMLLLVVAVALVACEGPMGPEGPVGPRGPNGDQGVTGPPGIPGANGSGLLLTQRCSGQASFGSTTYTLLHDIYRSADGSVLTGCEAWGPSFGVQATDLWRAGTVGANVGGCVLHVDVDAVSYGFWRFETTSEANGFAAYVDGGSTNNGRAFALTCSTQ